MIRDQISVGPKSVFQAAKDVLNRALVEETKVLSSIARWILWMLSSSEIRSARLNVKHEFDELVSQHKNSSGSGKTLVILLDQSALSFGFGDAMLVLMLGKYLLDLGYVTEIRYIPSLTPKTVSISKLCEVINLPLRTVNAPLTHSSVNAEEEHILFGADVAAGRDISKFCLALVSRIYRSPILNPQTIKPILRPFQVRPAQHISPSSGVRLQVGMAVRNQGYSRFRNPPEETVLADLYSICRSFPGADVIWFGDKEQFARVLDKARSKLLLGQCTLVFQKSEDYYSAIAEASRCDVWVQRFGGGIHVPIIFSSVPYVVVTNDMGAVLMVDYKNRKIGSWAEAGQLYIPRILRPLGSLDRALKKMKAHMDSSPS
jgi:hypothetical protein